MRFITMELAAAGRGNRPLSSAGHNVLGLALHRVGRPASRKALEELIADHGHHATYQIAEAHGARGERDEAFEWLRRAEGGHDPGLSEMKASPNFRSLHGDPRWSPFLKRMGLGD